MGSARGGSNPPLVITFCLLERVDQAEIHARAVEVAFVGLGPSSN